MGAYTEGVVIVREKESVIVRSIAMRIQELGYLHHVIDENVEEVDKVSEQADIYIVYLNNISEKAIKTLVYINDLIGDKGRRLIVIGDKDHYDLLIRAIPGIKDQIWIDRPLKMDYFNLVLDDIVSDIRKKSERKKILIVDDDPEYARMVREWIKDKFQVFVVTDGMQAISFLIKKEVDLILLDYEMPVVDGPKILEMLRTNPSTAHIPTVFLTGVGTKEAVSRVVSLKPDGYVLKSTSKGDLMKFLNSKLY